MTTYVLVHGGFTDGWYWGETATRLEKEGHRVLVADLPSTGRDPATLGGLPDDVAEVRRLVDEAGGPVVLVGHSYSGMVVTELADHPGVVHTVYVSAFLPARDQSLIDLFGSDPAPWMKMAADGAATRVTGDVELAHHALCADLDPSRVPEWHASLMWSSAAILGVPSTAPTPSDDPSAGRGDGGRKEKAPKVLETIASGLAAPLGLDFFPDGDAINFTSVVMPCRSENDPAGCGPRRAGLAVIGYPTNWGLAHIDGGVNPSTADTVRLFFSSPGPRDARCPAAGLPPTKETTALSPEAATTKSPGGRGAPRRIRPPSPRPP